jgi:glycosyltransferase involved in cell wall biosynthesis
LDGTRTGIHRTALFRRQAKRDMPDALISIVIPCKNEAPNLSPLFDEIDAVLGGKNIELVVVDDGSTDDTAAVLQREMSRRSFPIRHIRHDRSSGKSLALRSGAFAARGAIVATLDGDGQNDPKYVLTLVDALLEAGPSTGIAVGQRLKRKDTRLKQYASRFANWLRNAILSDNTRDTACGLKAVHADLLRKLPFFEGSHRFLPALVIQEGYGVVHRDVVDRPRQHGASHYGILDRGVHGALDLIGVWWLRRRRKNMPRVEEIQHG